MLPTRRVLLADDDLEVRRGVVELLLPLGLEVLQAESGPEALEIVRLRPSEVHAMVLDLHMPGCTGLEVLTRLRELPLPRSLPTIVYSGAATAEMRARVLAAGAWAFLHKPVQPDLLRGEVLRALRGREPGEG